MSTAFVLTGGGSLGAVQVGMLTALHECRIEPELLVGTPELGAGPAVSAVRASAAVPGVLPPVVRDGRTLVDGARGSWTCWPARRQAA